MIRLVVLFIFLFTISLVKAQDPHFSQFYANPMYLNPAFTGTGECFRVGTQMRSQWAGLDNAFNTVNFYMDVNHSDLNSGFGVMFLRDQIGTPKLVSNELHGLYSYHVALNDKYHIRFGLQASYVSKSIQYKDLLFEDQYQGIDLTGDPSFDPITQQSRANLFDVSSGVLLFKENKYWIGASGHHLTQPSTGFLYNSTLPIKLSVHGGMKFIFKKDDGLQSDKNIYKLTPAFNYKAQGSFDQLDLGLYLMRNFLMVGVWYRGLFLKKDNDIRNTDVVSLQLGAKVNQISIIYNYDFTTSGIGQDNTLGSHEISLQYRFCSTWPVRNKSKYKKLPCPDFK